MEVNAELRDQIFQIISNQMRLNNPTETKNTYQRLIHLGHSEFEAKQLIGQCVAVELFDIMKHHMPFNEDRYVKNLKKLPAQPFEDE